MSARARFDLDATSRAALELDAILSYAASFAAMEPGRAALRSLDLWPRGRCWPQSMTPWNKQGGTCSGSEG
jgi:hypothetical protein